MSWALLAIVLGAQPVRALSCSDTLDRRTTSPTLGPLFGCLRAFFGAFFEEQSQPCTLTTDRADVFRTSKLTLARDVGLVRRCSPPALTTTNVAAAALARVEPAEKGQLPAPGALR